MNVADPSGAGSRPVLGVVCGDRTLDGQAAQAVMESYLTAALTYADCAVLLIPSMPDLTRAHDVAARLDGVLLTGSPSPVTPTLSGRDAMATGMIEAMLELGRPVFGICRGLGDINVAFGGDLRADAGGGDGASVQLASEEKELDAMFADGHDVFLSSGGRLRRAMGRDRLSVNVMHRRGIDRLGARLEVEAIAADGSIEAVSATVNGAAVLAVHWRADWRAAENPDSQTFFRLLGDALRGRLR